MADTDVALVAAGVVTAVGVTLPEAAAAIRARTMRFSESPFRDRDVKPVIMATVPEDALPPLDAEIDAQPKVSSRERRILRLAAQALAQVMPLLPKSAGKVPLSIAIPRADGPIAIDGATFLERLAIQSKAPIALPGSTSRQDGRAGGLLALSDARDLLQRGVARYVIAGGVDTYRDAKVLASLDTARRLKTSSNRDAFIPGEAAALLLLTTVAQARRDALQPLAVCSGAAMSFEDGHLLSATPYKGEALAGAIAELASRGEISAPVGEVYSSMNGEHHWGREWSIALMRQRALFDPEHEFHHPADCYGDLGSATGPMLVALAAIGQQKQYRRSPALVYCSSDDGPRAAVFVHQGA